MKNENTNNTIDGVKTDTIDGIDIIEKDGITYFVASDELKKEEEQRHQEELKKLNEPKTWWEKITNWFRKHDVSPYARIKDLADPFGDRKKDPDDIDVSEDGKNIAEVGIKLKF